jgi:hypothetical protein
MSSNRKFTHLYSIAAGAVASALMATPALAVSLSLPANFPLSTRELILAGIGVLLVALLGLMIFSRRHRVEVASEEPDLRWWRNSPGEVSHRMSPAQNPSLMHGQRSLA